MKRNLKAAIQKKHTKRFSNLVNCRLLLRNLIGQDKVVWDFWSIQEKKILTEMALHGSHHGFSSVPYGEVAWATTWFANCDGGRGALKLFCLQSPVTLGLYIRGKLVPFPFPPNHWNAFRLIFPLSWSIASSFFISTLISLKNDGLAMPLVFSPNCTFTLFFFQ